MDSQYNRKICYLMCYPLVVRSLVCVCVCVGGVTCLINIVINDNEKDSRNEK